MFADRVRTEPENDGDFTIELPFPHPAHDFHLSPSIEGIWGLKPKNDRYPLLFEMADVRIPPMNFLIAILRKLFHLTAALPTKRIFTSRNLP